MKKHLQVLAISMLITTLAMVYLFLPYWSKIKRLYFTNMIKHGILDTRNKTNKKQEWLK